ncbi:MAG: LysR family transcriptional regulator [Gammaproteobacteria bacterium]|nr:LysR family transcriptional regulator [Gammaproteobacteria bacterium]
MYKPTFRQLQIFEAVARHNSVTRAAEELFMTQSSVSTQLKQMRTRIGHPLYEQSGKKILITAAGEKLVWIWVQADRVVC